MSHYAKLAALGFRWVAVAGLLYSLPGMVMMLRVTTMPGIEQKMQLWTLVSVFLFPVVAVILFLIARPLGTFVAQGLE